MLRKLQIQHYAIIDAIEIEFSPRLNIITGETGAGKSILMGALSLILGERADSSVLMYADKKCVIEGYFQVANKTAVIAFLQQHELDVDTELVLRREIAPNGKSRAFINDTPASLQQLKELASLLVDLHQQFDTLSLGDTDFQRNVLDALAGNQTELAKYQSVYQELQITRRQKIARQGRRRMRGRVTPSVREGEIHPKGVTAAEAGGAADRAAGDRAAATARSGGAAAAAGSVTQVPALAAIAGLPAEVMTTSQLPSCLVQCLQSLRPRLEWRPLCPRPLFELLHRLLFGARLILPQQMRHPPRVGPQRRP